jgi:hypothetical protein
MATSDDGKTDFLTEGHVPILERLRQVHSTMPVEARLGCGEENYATGAFRLTRIEIVQGRSSRQRENGRAQVQRAFFNLPKPAARK